MGCVLLVAYGGQGGSQPWGRFSLGSGLPTRLEATKDPCLQGRPWSKLAQNASQHHFHWLTTSLTFFG